MGVLVAIWWWLWVVIVKRSELSVWLVVGKLGLGVNLMGDG